METSKEPEEKIESINIEQDNTKYILTLKIKGDQLTLVLSVPEMQNLFFTKKMTFKEIKELDKDLEELESCEDFYDCLKQLKEEKNLTIIEKEQNLCLKLTIKHVTKKNIIELILSPEAKNNDEFIKGLYNEIKSLNEKIKILESKEGIINELKADNDKLKEEIKNLREEINEVKALIEPMKRFKEININRYTKFNEKSVIMGEDEFNNIIKNHIEVKINQKIKELKKLYQATVDGDVARSFHLKCDGIPNTLVIIKSEGNRRFGGFTTRQWSSPDSFDCQFDKNAFLFSLDKPKVYPFIGQEQYQNYSNNLYAIYSYKDYGPSFGGCNIYGNGFDSNFAIYISSNCIHGSKSSYTYESNTNSSYNFYKDNNALSEDGKKGGIYIAEYEVFQVIFE